MQLVTGLSMDYQIILNRLNVFTGLNARRTLQNERNINGSIQGYRINSEDNADIYESIESDFIVNRYVAWTFGIQYYIY